MVHHFMFAPAWDAGCKSCALVADQAEGALVHVRRHDEYPQPVAAASCCAWSRREAAA